MAQRLAGAFESLKVGDPNDDDTVLGPLISEGHRERVLGYIKQAVDEGKLNSSFLMVGLRTMRLTTFR